MKNIADIKFRKKYTTYVGLLMVCRLACLVSSSQCPIGVDLFHTLNAHGFKYSNFDDLSITNGYVSEDSSAIYTFANGQLSSNPYSMIFRMNHTFGIQWNRCLQGSIYHEAMKLTSDDNSIIVTPYSTSDGKVFKLDTSDGSILLQK